MNFEMSYLLAMQDMAPRLLRELQKTHRLDAHLKQVTEQAYALRAEVLTNMGADPERPYPQQAAEAREIVYAEMMQFPEDGDYPWRRKRPT